MDFEIRLLYSILIYLSFIALCFAPIGLYFSFRCLKTVHYNLRFLIVTLGILWCILPIGGMYFYFILDAPENPPDLYSRIDYQIAKNICAITGYALRVTETAICIERLFATIYFETYETKKIFRIYSLFATFVTLIISVSFSLLFNIFQVPAVVIYVFLIIVETTNFILLHILRKQNHRLRKMSNSNRALLTSKYQLIENIKSVNLLFPPATISFVISNATLIISISLREFYIEGFAPPLFYTFYCCNIIVVCLYWINQSQWFKFHKLKLKKYWFKKVNNSTDVIILKATTVKTALGHTVNIQQTAEDYFINLKNVWN